MARFISKALLFCFLFQIFSAVWGIPFILNTEHDVEDEWTINGNTVYVEKGSGLRQALISQFLPGNFDYPMFDQTVGVWAVVPDKNKPCAVFGDDDSDDWMKWSSDEKGELHTTIPTTEPPPCDISASASFRCILKAQTLSAVTLRYNFGGNATLRITKGNRHPLVISANNLVSKDWVNFKVKDLEGSMMLLEAIVNKTGDYVLIDRITVESLDADPVEPTDASDIITTSTTTPSTRRPKTKSSAPKTSAPHSATTATTSTESTTTTATSTAATTSTEQPKPTPPANGQNGIFNSVPLNIIIFSYFATIKIVQYLSV